MIYKIIQDKLNEANMFSKKMISSNNMVEGFNILNNKNKLWKNKLWNNKNIIGIFLIIVLVYLWHNGYFKNISLPKKQEVLKFDFNSQISNY